MSSAYDRDKLVELFGDDPHTLAEVERSLLLAALKEADANLSKAARTLGISRDTLRYRARKYNIAC